MENCQIGVFLAYGSRRGNAFLDRELYLPQVWAEDWERRREAGVPEDAVFHTKGQLAQRMIGRALGAGVPFAWVAGDTVYGNDRRLRRWLEEEGVSYVLAVKSNEPLWAATQDGPAPVAARELAQGIPDGAWHRLSAGDGSKGPRIHYWSRVPLRPWSAPDQWCWLLVRRSIADPEDLAYYGCFSSREVPLEELVRVAGTRWVIEDTFKEAKGQVGLDQYEVRRWSGWYRHITLAMLVHAFLAGPGSVPLRATQKGGGDSGRVDPMTVPEIRRLLYRLLRLSHQSAGLVLGWPQWRRRHQARALQSHYKRRCSHFLPNCGCNTKPVVVIFVA